VRVAWAVGVAALIFGAWVTIEERYVYTAARASGDLEAAARSLDRLNAVGFSHEALRIELGVELLSRGRAGAARDQFQKSIDIRPTPEAYVGLGESLERSGDWQGAARAYEGGLTVEPDRLGLLHRSGEAWLKAGRPAQALSRLERAVEIAPDHEPSRRALAVARELGARRSQQPGLESSDGAPD
jgi:tetratricopeptide (TPR) repeat protein